VLDFQFAKAWGARLPGAENLIDQSLSELAISDNSVGASLNGQFAKAVGQ
jgi:hypothetical protein